MRKKRFIIGKELLGICMAIAVSCCPFIEVSAQENGKIEVASYLGTNLSKAVVEFEGMSEPYWVMGTLSSQNEQISFVGTGDAADEDLITQISLSGKSNPYSIYGLSTDMTQKIAEICLLEQGFQKIFDQSTYYDGNSRFVSVKDIDGFELKISLSEMEWEADTDKEEVFVYMGCAIEQVQNQIPGLTMRKDGKNIILEKDGLEMSGTDRITQIKIYGHDCDYSIYGITPDSEGEKWERGSALNFSGGGTGEFFDPAGNILNLYGMINEEEPFLMLQSQ